MDEQGAPGSPALNEANGMNVNSCPVSMRWTLVVFYLALQRRRRVVVQGVHG